MYASVEGSRKQATFIDDFRMKVKGSGFRVHVLNEDVLNARRLCV